MRVCDDYSQNACKIHQHIDLANFEKKSGHPTRRFGRHYFARGEYRGVSERANPSIAMFGSGLELLSFCFEGIQNMF